MNLYLQELRQNRTAFFIWSFFLGIYNVFYISLFPGMQKLDLNSLLQAYPKQLLSAFNFDILNLSTILGFYGSEGHLFLILFGGIFALLMAANILAKEESDKTIEFLYAKPVTRTGIVTAKLLAYLTYLVLFDLVVNLAVFIALEAFEVGAYNRSTFFYLALGAFLAHLALASLGFLLSAVLSHSKRVLPLAMGLSLGTYGLDLVANLTEQAKALRYLSPYYYANAAAIIERGGMEGARAAILIGVFVVSTVLAYVVYNRKDITT